MVDKFPPLNVNLEPSVTFPIEDVKVDPENLKELLHIMSLPVTNLKCPDCGKPLVFDHETECELIFYCVKCKHKIKAKKERVCCLNE